MVVIVCGFDVDVEDLSRVTRLPSVEALRPTACPSCQTPARRPGERLGVVGHGTYERQVLGRGDPLVIHVRRYRCRGCPITISVLPSDLLPWRWYASGAILLALSLTLLAGKSAAAAQRALGVVSSTPGWKTAQRWQRQLLAPLWSFAAAQLGFGSDPPGVDRRSRQERLRALLSLHGASVASARDELDRVSRALVSGRVFARG